MIRSERIFEIVDNCEQTSLDITLFLNQYFMMSRQKNPFRSGLLYIWILLIAAGCTPETQQKPTAVYEPTSPATPKITRIASLPGLDSPTATGSPQSQPSALSTQTGGFETSNPQASTTPDHRLPPEDWQNWPIVPTVSARAAAIYQKGISLGTDPHAFSVVGDCQSIPGVFLGLFGNPLGYSLKAGDERLKDTIEYFHDSFAREGNAVQGGFTAASLLSPMQSNPDDCKPGETPLTCEMRVHNPSILIISLETWRNPETINRYEGYLRQIVDISIQHGVLPILATKADMAETGQKHIINPAVAKIAYEYDLPMLNFWRAAQSIEYHGIDPARDGFHLTKEGFVVKSYTALQALDFVWREITHQDTSGAQADQPTSTTDTVATQAPPINAALHIAESFQQSCLPSGTQKTDCALFSLAESRDGEITDKGVYLFNLTNQDLTEISADGFSLQSISPNGRVLLINNSASLYAAPLDGSDPVLITDRLLDHGTRSAYWHPDGKKIILLANRDGEYGIWQYDLAGSSWTRITATGDRPMNLIPSSNTDLVYWEKGSCSSKRACSPEGTWSTGLNGSSAQELAAISHLSISPDHETFSFIDPKDVNDFGYNDNLVIEKASERLLSRRLIIFPPANGYKVRNRLNSYFWSPDNQKLFILLDEFSKYYEQSAGYHLFQFLIKPGLLFEYPRLTGVMPGAAWSPDSSRLLLFVTKQTSAGQYRLSFEKFELATQARSELNQNKSLRDLPYTYVTNLAWFSSSK